MALASGWGTGQIGTWGNYDYVVDRTFYPAANNNVHCPLPKFEEWRALPVYEHYHPPIAPQAQQPELIVNGHLITSNLCWYQSHKFVVQACENHATYGD